MNIILFLITAFIWGTTWLAIKYQLGVVHPLWSLAYRFGISALILVGYCLITKTSLKFTREQHRWIAFQALLLFSVNYFLYYLGSGYFVSGIVAVLFASVVVMNNVNSRLFLKIPISLSTIAGSLMGLSGLGLIFSTEVHRLWEFDTSYILAGLAFCLGGTLCASFGQMVAMANMRRGLPILQTNALGMFYGAIMCGLGALVMGELPTFDFTLQYTYSLLYLSLFGTVLAFGTYLKLVSNIGPGRAAYAFVLIPLVALVVSSLFEDFAWNELTLWGAFLILLGNVIVLSKKKIPPAKDSDPLPSAAR